MTRTIGADNSIAWVQVRLRGGLRNLLTTTATYAGVIALAMIGTTQLIPERPGQILSAWVAGIMALQAVVLLLFAPSRVAAAIRQDISSGIIESHRLMPVAGSQAVLGYILGSTSQSMCLALANVVIGGYAAIASGIAAAHWLGANALLLGFAVFVWVLLACAAMHPRSPLMLLFIAPAGVLMAQGGAIGLAPGLMLLITPLLGASIFDMSVTLGGLTQAFTLSIVAQIVVGAICFAAAARKYRRADVIGFTPALGLLLLASWVALSWIGTVWWERLKPQYMPVERITAQAQLLTSLIIAMVLALVPVCAAAEQTIKWTGRVLLDDSVTARKPVPDWVVILGATLLVLPLALAPETLLLGARPSPQLLALAAATVVLHLATVSYLRRLLRFYFAKANLLMFLWLGLLWIGPLLADLVRYEMGEDYDQPILTEISCLSPAGTLVALMKDRVNEVSLGLSVQAIVAGVAALLYHLVHPVRRHRPIRISAEPS